MQPLGSGDLARATMHARRDQAARVAFASRARRTTAATRRSEQNWLHGLAAAIAAMRLRAVERLAQ
jgi:hypothetical protein